MRNTMPYSNLQRYPQTIWRSVHNGLNRMGIHPLVALGCVLLLIIIPRLVILAVFVYAGYWLYRNGVFSGHGPTTRAKGCHGRGGGRRKGRR
jgi:hypothetical protein